MDRVKKTYQYFTRVFRFFKNIQLTKAVNEISNYHHFFYKLQKNPYWGFDRILEIEKCHKVKSTFYFLNESGGPKIFSPQTWKLYLGRYDIKNPDIIQIIRKLKSEGWEIGLHGSYKSFQNKDLLKKEKEDLESILGAKIYGIRQHYLNLDIPRTWKYQEELGFKYDSSFSYRNPAENRMEHLFPFWPFESSRFLILPLSLMDADLLSYNNDDMWGECVRKIEHVEEVGGLLTINWHQERCNDNEFPDNLKNYESIIQLCLDKNAWITTAYDIYKWTVFGNLNEVYK